jgi:hypothetical protein
MRPLGKHPVCQKCGYDLSGVRSDRCPECGSPPFDAGSHEAEKIDRSVWDEPGLSGALAGRPPDGAETFAGWLERMRRETTWTRSWIVTAAVAAAAGPWAVLGAFWGSGQTAFSVLALTVFGPITEEVMKAAATTYVIERRPYLFRAFEQILLCGLAAGFAFAALENVLYLYVYVPDARPTLVAWRWTVCVALHMGCTLITHLGLARVWGRTMSGGTRPDLAGAFPLMVTAVVVHGTYNAGALVLSVSTDYF